MKSYIAAQTTTAAQSANKHNTQTDKHMAIRRMECNGPRNKKQQDNQRKLNFLPEWFLDLQFISNAITRF